MTTVPRGRANGRARSGSGRKAKKHHERQHCTGKDSQLLDNNESEKNEEHSSSVQIGLFVFSVPLPAILLKEVFSLNCKSKLVI